MDKVLIISADELILYQPTILNLYDFLSTDFDVTIISFEPRFLGKKKETTRNIVYLSCPESKRKPARLADLLINAVLKRIDKYIFPCRYRSQRVRRLKYNVLLARLKQINCKRVIAVDHMPLLAAQQVYGRTHFLSLEIIPHDSYRAKTDNSLIQSVIIQNRERYEYLFHGLQLPVFYIQNAPFCRNIFINEQSRSGLLWAGSIVKEFDVFKCLDFIRAYPQYKITLKGASEEKTRRQLLAQYKDLLQSGNAVINEDYLTAEDFIKYLSAFRIGFCFYSWALVKRNFNYQSAPSGKLFMYLCAGVPVIACNIPAFRFLEEMGAGVLVDDYEPVTLYNAIQTIENKYEQYCANSYKAAARFCFDNNAGAFKDYLKSAQTA